MQSLEKPAQKSITQLVRTSHVSDYYELSHFEQSAVSKLGRPIDIKIRQADDVVRVEAFSDGRQIGEADLFILREENKFVDRLYPKSYAELTWLSVSDGFKKEGVGSAMLQSIFSLAKQLELKAILGVVKKWNKAAMAMDERAGFVRIPFPETWNGGNGTFILLQKEIS